MSLIDIRKADVAFLTTDAVVNAANESLRPSGEVCKAIFRAAGEQELTHACRVIGHCETGSAVITPGFHLTAKYIIHAVGPEWNGGSSGSLLEAAYRNALRLAVENGCGSVGFPLLSAGGKGFPEDTAWETALKACRDFIGEGNKLDIIFAVLSDSEREKGRKILQSIAPDLACAVKRNWRTLEMPEQRDAFILRRTFTPEQMSTLRRGHVPWQMEDKWFWYMEGDSFFAHRSWTGFCIFRIDFSPDGLHKVTVNRDPQQCGSTDIEYDRVKLNEFLDWWTGDPYDFMGAWEEDTNEALLKAAMMHAGGQAKTENHETKDETPNS